MLFSSINPLYDATLFRHCILFIHSHHCACGPSPLPSDPDRTTPNSLRVPEMTPQQYTKDQSQIDPATNGWALFIPPDFVGSNTSWAASMLNITCDDSAVYALQCTAGTAPTKALLSCGPDAPVSPLLRATEC